MSLSMGSAELEMAGGVAVPGSGHRVELGLGAVGGRPGREQYGMNLGGSGSRPEAVKKPRPGNAFGEYSDPHKFLGRDRSGFMLSAAEKGCRKGGQGFRLERRAGDERKNLYSGEHLTALGMRRESDWESGGTGDGEGRDYGDLRTARGEVSELSQSEGTEEEEEEEDEGGDQGGGMGVGRAREVLEEEHEQMSGVVEGRMVRQDSSIPPPPSREVEGFLRSMGDIGSKEASSASPSFGLYLQPSPHTAGLFLNYASPSPAGGQLIPHEDAPQNGGGGGGGEGEEGTSAGIHYTMRDEGVTRDSYTGGLASRENSLGVSVHSHQSQAQLDERLHTAEENYYTSLLTSSRSSSRAQKGQELRSDVGSPGQKRNSRMVDSGPPTERSLRSILSDPISGQLMEDATIFACGHSFGSVGLQQVLATNICSRCGASVQTRSMAANYALRAAIQAFKREEEGFPVLRPGKRRKDRSDQEHGGSSGQHSADGNRSKGVQFPFSVSDRVLIKGNKRTPERFVGREAIITNQCLNGWYLVRTLDHGDSVRLQYRSLEKLGSHAPQSCTSSHFAPTWL